MSSPEKTSEEAILPPNAFECLNSIKLLRPRLLGFPRYSDSFDNRNNIPPPSHRVMVFKARLEREMVLNKIENAYAGLPYYSKGGFSELLQWLHRFDFTQDDEEFFDKFLNQILGSYSDPPLFHRPILQTETHKFYLVCRILSPMNAAWDGKRGKIDVKSEKLLKCIQEFKPALEAERDSDTEERFLPLRFGLPVGKVICFANENKKKDSFGHCNPLLSGYIAFHLVFHPIDKSFWMVVDRYQDLDGHDSPLDGDHDKLKYIDNRRLTRILRDKFGRQWGEKEMEVEAFRLGSKDLWVPQGLGLNEREKQARELDGNVSFDGNKSEEPVSRFRLSPTIDFSSLPKVSLFPDTDPPQIQFATHTSFQNYLAENGVVKGSSWLSVSPLPN